MEIIIKDATINDARNLQALIHEMGYKINDEGMQIKLHRFIADPHKQIYIAFAHSQAIGFIAVVINDMIINNFNRAWIEAIMVAEKYRKFGVGRLLIKKAEEFAKANNCLNINLISNAAHKQKGTHIFYDKLGYTNNSLLGKKVFLRKDLKDIAII